MNQALHDERVTWALYAMCLQQVAISERRVNLVPGESEVMTAMLQSARQQLAETSGLDFNAIQTAADRRWAVLQNQAIAEHGEYRPGVLAGDGAKRDQR